MLQPILRALGLARKIPNPPGSQDTEVADFRLQPEELAGEQTPIDTQLVGSNSRFFEQQVVAPPALRTGNYTLPGPDLFDESDVGAPAPIDLADLQGVQQKIVDALSDFGIAVAPGDITRGPTVTRYEIYPARGVRLGQIRRLEHDLARATRAERIAKIAPVPGKETIAVDLPNEVRFTVSAAEMFSSGAWVETAARIPLALGKNTNGKHVIVDLAEMPHLLIGGMPGSGKSSCLDAIIVSLLVRFAPDELRLILYDAHYSQMQVYNKLPHLILPVLSDPQKARLMLRHVASELDNRAKLFASAGVEDIGAFNDRSPSGAFGGATAVSNRLPYIVVVIDELTDLVRSAPADVQELIKQITDNCAAAGIHLVMASKPDFGSLSALKARAPGRIALQVRSEDESYAVVDEEGAERLLGNGDMLCLTPRSPLAERLQGVFLAENEVRRIVDFVSAQAPLDYSDAIDTRGGGLRGDIAQVDEELVAQCLEVIRQEKRASTSLLQRRLRLGYSRAAEVINILEQRGVLGPGEGARPREILVDLDSA